MLYNIGITALFYVEIAAAAIVIVTFALVSLNLEYFYQWVKLSFILRGIPTRLKERIVARLAWRITQARVFID